MLSTDDPVRVFQRFSTLNALSNGRAEVILGRGSFTESYPLFGYDLSRYEELFEDKLRLFAELLKPGPVTWSGTTRTPLAGATIYPPIENGRAAHLGRRRRQPGVGRPRGALRSAADAGDHRRQPATLPPVRRPLPPGAREARPAGAAGRRAFARPRRGDRRAGQERAVAALRGDDQPHRRRARLAAGDARAVRARGRPRRRAVRRLARDRRGQDRRDRSGAGAVALRHEVQRRHAAARGADDEHRAHRDQVAPRVRELLA